MVEAGKYGNVYLLDRDNLGGEVPGGPDRSIGTYGPNGGVWSQVTVWPGDGGYVYIPTASPGDAAWRFQRQPDRLQIRCGRQRQPDADVGRLVKSALVFRLVVGDGFL